MRKIFYILKNYGSYAILSINGNTDPFSLLSNNNISNDTNLRGTFASFYQLLKVVGIIGIIASIVICGLKLSSKVATTREEGKNQLLTKGIISIAIFSFIGILGMILDVLAGIA